MERPTPTPGAATDASSSRKGHALDHATLLLIDTDDSQQLTARCIEDDPPGYPIAPVLT